MKHILFVLPALTFCLCLHAVEITRDGKAVSDIAIPQDAVSSVRFAAEELRKFIELVSGARLDIVEEKSPRKFDNRIFIGCGAPPEDKSVFAWRIKADKRNLYLHGNDAELTDAEASGLLDKLRGWRINSSGSILAVYDFTDRNLGIRFIRPGDRGIVAPAKKSISFDPFERTGKPRWESVGMSIPAKADRRMGGWKDFSFADGFITETRLWMFRHGMVDTYWFPGKGHAFVDYWKRFGKTRPEFFALLADGTRRPLTGNNNGRHVPMCISNPKLHSQLMWEWKNRKSRWHEGPYNYLSVCDNDTPGLCTCEKCRAWDGANFKATGPYWGDKKVPAARDRFAPFRGPDGVEPPEHSLSDRYCNFYLTMLRKAVRYNPDVRIYGHAYANATLPPQTVKLNDRILISYAASPVFPMTAEKMEASRRRWEGWAASGCSLEYRPNSTWAYGCMPYQYTKQLGTEYRMALHTPQLRRVFFDCMRCEFSSQGLMYYTIARLTRHPEMTIDKIADEYFAAFGKAEPAVRKYYALWQKISDAVTIEDVEEWKRRSGLELNMFTNGDFSAYILKPEYFTESAKILEEAAQKADTPQAGENVKFLQAGLEHARMTWRMQTARLENVNHPSPVAEKKFKQALQDLIAFRNAHEKMGISDMGRLSFYERQGFPRSKPLKK